MKTCVIGVGNTKFGEHWNSSLTDLLAESQLAAIRDARVEISDIDAIFTGNMCASFFSNQTNIGSIASQILNIHVPGTAVEGACASGGLALRSGISSIESGQARVVLVNGVEKMTDVSTVAATSGLASASSFVYEQYLGSTFPALNAMIARLYMHTYGLTREELAMVSVKNHENGFLNPNAHFRKKITVEDVINAPKIADPLTLFDCSPISDGAATLILCDESFAKERGLNAVKIIGSGHATDTLSMCEREDLLTWSATQIAAKKAFEMAGVSHDEIDVLELHDGFSITQLLTLEDLGFCKKGEAGKISIEGLHVNPSGGLKSRGHPVGATGVAQAAEIVMQLRGACGERQAKNATVGMTQNAGGCGSNVVVHIFRGES